MRRTAKELRDLIATLPDEAPVFAEVWTPEDVRVWLRQWIESSDEDEWPPCDLDLDDPEVIARAMDCIPLGDWSSNGDDLMEEFHIRLDEAFGVASNSSSAVE
jgi:hypothetical protein